MTSMYNVHYKISIPRTSALLNIPYETHLEDGCTRPDCFKGMFADVWHLLQDIMNFTYKMYMPEDGQWGALREDGTWTGIVGKCITSQFKTTLHKRDFVDYCYCTYICRKSLSLTISSKKLLVKEIS